MKRNVLLLIPLMLGLGLSSCSSSIPNQDEVDKVKEMLSKQDLSQFYTKTLQGMYSQEYDVLDLYSDEEEKTSSYLNYSGAGFFGMYYDLTVDQYNSVVDEKGNVDTFDAIAEGKGYYGLLQVARTMSFNREDGLEATIVNLDILQSTTVKSTDQDLWVDNTLYLTDTGTFHEDSMQWLSASINKELLFNNVSTRAFREIFSTVNLFDAPGNIEHLDKLYLSICRDLATKSDKEISDFIIANQISIEAGEEEEENIVKLNFVYTNENVDEDEEEYIFLGGISGTLKYDKETYEFLGFSYEMQQTMETIDEESGNIKLITTKFTYEGESYRGLPHDEWEPTNPTIYDDVADFLEDVNEQVVPPNFNL